MDTANPRAPAGIPRSFRSHRNKNQCRGWVGFSNKMAHRITAAADILLMPSRFEPCGLNQLYAMAYGTVPIVHSVGGLRDTVKQYSPFENVGTGWVFERAEVGLDAFQPGTAAAARVGVLGSTKEASSQVLPGLRALNYGAGILTGRQHRPATTCAPSDIRQSHVRQPARPLSNLACRRTSCARALTTLCTPTASSVTRSAVSSAAAWSRT